MVPPAKSQVVERETLQLGECRFKAYGGWRNLGPDGPRSLWQSAPLSLDRAGRSTSLSARFFAADCYRKMTDIMRQHPNDYETGYEEEFAALIARLDPLPTT